MSCTIFSSLKNDQIFETINNRTHFQALVCFGPDRSQQDLRKHSVSILGLHDGTLQKTPHLEICPE